MDAVVALVGQLSSILGPALPFLLGAGQNVAEGAAKKLEAESWSIAQALWARLQPSLTQRPAAQEAARDVAANPSDADAQAALRMQLRKLLQDQPSLATELRQLLDKHAASTTVTAIGERSVAIGRDVTGSSISTGDTQPRQA